MLTAMVFMSTGASNLRAGCMDLADEPLEISNSGAPGMIMLVYDNSGSMEFTVMTEESEGSFHTPTNSSQYYGYCFLYDCDYGGSDLPTQEGSGDELYWKSQWSGYSTIYYNPDVVYEPWPAWTTVADVDIIPASAPNADPDNPLTFVVKSEGGNIPDTYPMSRVWASVEIGGGTSIDDLIEDVGIIVDNSDTRAVDAITVDDEGDALDEVGFTYTGNAGNWTRLGGDQYWNYYNADVMYYNGATNPLPVSATWSFNVLTAGSYNVKASIPYNSNHTRYATYAITHAGGTTNTTISQYNSSGESQDWVSLGTYNFAAGNGAGRVVLNFTAVDTRGRTIVGVDAIRLEPTFTTGSPVEYFESTGPWGVNPGGGFGPNYLWTPQINQTYTGLWTANNLIRRADYDVYARWAANAYRSTAVQYIVDGTTVSVNQRLNNNQWVLLKADANWGNTTTGTVSLSHTCTNINTDRACADAVAFVPASAAGGTVLDIVIAHYFVQNATGTYLVNLDGGIKYYRFTDDGDDKVENGELTEMTAQEAKDAGIFKDDYDRERQNFANWFQFARSRNHVSKYAVGTLISKMGNIYFGFTTIPSRDIYSLRAVKEGTVLNQDDTMLVLNNLYNLASPSGGTPLKDGFQKVSNFFEFTTSSLVSNEDKAYFIDEGVSNIDCFPYLDPDHGGHCQQAFMIAMTDGWYNSNTASNVGDHDSDGDTDWDGGGYADGYQGTLADISMDMYERDLKDDLVLIDEVPTNEWDKNKAQHVVTYALAFGTKGTIDPMSDDWVNCPSADGTGQSCGTWPFPVDQSETTIDDLYHSTVNGRGMFLNAGNPQELVAALMAIKQNIEERLGSSAAVTTTSVQRQIGSKLYRGQYMTGKWTGDLEAFEIEVKTGAVLPDVIWSAKDKLDADVDANGYQSRKIYSSSGGLGSGMWFDFNNLTPDQITRLNQGLAYGFGTGVLPATQDLVNYLRGDESKDNFNGGSFRHRTSLLGDIVHSEAEYRDNILYVAANDGMLHAFSSEDGTEVGAYIPNMLYSELGKLAHPAYQHQYFIDGSPFSQDLGGQKLLVCPMKKGYKGLFMLDITAPLGQQEPAATALWEYPGAGVTDAFLGYTYSDAGIFKTKAAGWVVITGNGYESDNGTAVLYVLNAFTGGVVERFDTEVGGCNGLSSPAIIDPNGDGMIDYVYAGDLLGNMWKFDLSGDTLDDWDFGYKDGDTPMPLISVTDPSGNPQPITNMGAVVYAEGCNPDSYGYIILFGTGKYLGLTDLADTSQQSVYAVYDWAPDWEKKTGNPDGDLDKYLGTFDAGRALANADAKTGKTLSLVQQSVTTSTAYGGETYRFISDYDVEYYNVEADQGSALGWYMDLPDSKERMVRRPLVRNGVFMFVSNIPQRSVCSAGGSSVLYQVDACTGGWPNDPQFDTNGDGVFNEDDLIGGQPPGGQEHDGIIQDPTLLQNNLYLNPGGGGGETGDEKVKTVPIPDLPIGAWFWHVIE